MPAPFGPPLDGPAVDALLALKSPAFASRFDNFSNFYLLYKRVGGARPALATTHQLRLLEYAAELNRAEGKKIGEQGVWSYRAGDLLEAAIESAEDAALDRVGRLVAAVPRDMFWAQHFESLAVRLFRREIQAMRKEGVAPVKV